MGTRHLVIGIDQVDGQRVVRHDFRQRVGNRIEHRAAVAREQQALGDLEQLSLAGQPPFERLAAPLQLLDLACVRQGDGGLGADDLGEAQVGRVECAAAKAGEGQHAEDLVLVHERHQEHRFVHVRGARDPGAARVGANVGHDFCHARVQPRDRQGPDRPVMRSRSGVSPA